MQFDAQCIACLVKRQAKRADAQHDPENAYRYMRDVMQILLDAPEGVAAPYMTPKFEESFGRYWPDAAQYEAEKKLSNENMLPRLPEMRRIVEAAEDPLLMALKFTQTGNYIDFGALAGNVDMDLLDRMIADTPNNEIDPVEYGHFVEDLSKARKLLYIADNAGEIVADRVMVEQLLARYPSLGITFAVRGGPALNDATREDAAAVGLDKLVKLVDNGSCISGTELNYLGDEMKAALEQADIVLSKGQANFETMITCGYNVYYVFLCKCERFTRMFQVPMLKGMFLNERRTHVDSAFC